MLQRFPFSATDFIVTLKNETDIKVKLRTREGCLLSLTLACSDSFTQSTVFRQNEREGIPLIKIENYYSLVLEDMGLSWKAWIWISSGI